MRYHVAAARMAGIQKVRVSKCWRDVEKGDPLCPAGGNLNWYRHYGKQYRCFFKKIKIELPCDPAIPFLRIYPKGMKTQCWKGICSPCSLQHYLPRPKCPSTDG